MNLTNNIQVIPLTAERFNEAVNVVTQFDPDPEDVVRHDMEHFTHNFVAIHENKVVGVSGWYHDTVNYANEAMGADFPGEDAYWLGFFDVDIKFQKQGVGSIMLERVESEVKSQGATRLWVVSVPGAQEFYTKKGFNLVKQGKIRGLEKYFMVKDL